MKITMENGRMTATAETLKDASTLLRLAGKEEVPETKERATYTRTCAKCGAKAKGIRGLAMHDTRTHQGKTWSSWTRRKVAAEQPIQ